MAEGILKYQKGIHMEMKGSLSSFIQKKKNTMKSTKKKKKKFKGKEKKKKIKSQGKCFLYGKKGHWKKECPKFLKRESQVCIILL